ncbi:MAG: ATP synthase F1 subunit gamma [Rickettsiales bacterium]
MSNLKQLKLRIAGVKSTQKITKAMKMVAASKLLKAQDQRDLSKTYAAKMNNLIANISASVVIDNNSSPLFAGNGNDKKHLLIVVSSDKGLCGAFNSQIIRKVKLIASSCIAQNKELNILFLGKKAYESLKDLYSEHVIEVIPAFSNNKFKYVQANEVVGKVLALFNDNKFDKCSIIYTEFVNALKQNIMHKSLIPMMDSLPENEDKQEFLYEYEPRQQEILDKMVPINLATQLYHAILESITSEHASRMTAMDSATNNAKDMLGHLTLLYNRSRQAAITTELIEIISSAEAL